MTKLFKYLSGLTALLIMAACHKDIDNSGTIYCDPGISYAGFRVVDKTSNTDLFFGSTPRYKRADLKIYPVDYKNEMDTLTLRTFSSATQQAFIFTIQSANVRDTILVKIADTGMDTLIYTVKRPSNACAPYSIEQAYFNRNEIFQDNGVFNFKK